MPKEKTDPEETLDDTTLKFTEGPVGAGWDGLTSWPLMQPSSPTVDEPKQTPNKRKKQAAADPKNPKKLKKPQTFEEWCEQERVEEAYGRGRSITPPGTQDAPDSPQENNSSLSLSPAY